VNFLIPHCIVPCFFCIVVIADSSNNGSTLAADEKGLYWWCCVFFSCLLCTSHLWTHICPHPPILWDFLEHGRSFIQMTFLMPLVTVGMCMLLDTVRFYDVTVHVMVHYQYVYGTNLLQT